MDFTSPYYWYEFTHAALSPARMMVGASRLYFDNPFNPLSRTPVAKNVAAGLEMFERMTRRYGKPEFGLKTTLAGGERVKVTEETVWEKPFCRLIHFRKASTRRPGPRVLIVAPMSGHYATLLRGTVEAFLPEHDVYVTDWTDARMVPLAEGDFDLDDYIDYVTNMFHHLGGDCHVVAVCQPAVPVLAAVALMEERGDPYAPHTMTLMGGPIDTRVNPTAVNQMAQERDLDWFRRNVVMKVPFPHPGMMRDVYPGFLQLSGFMSMNLDRHVSAHREMFRHLVDGDGDSAEKHRDFYDEYLAVMDLSAEFYLQTVDTVFIKHSLPKGEMMHRGRRVDCSKITKVALLTVEGERDDISGVGQTKAAHALCTNLSDEMKMHYMQPRVGHYGVFNGSRFRAEILPRISDFMRSHKAMTTTASSKKDTAEATAPVKKTAAPAGTMRNGKAAASASTNGTAAKSGAALTAKEAKKADPAAPVDGSILLKKPKGAPDDLTRIKGIGPVVSTRLNDHGIYHFWQLARLDKDTRATIEKALGFPGRIAREKWIDQARQLAG